MAYTDEQIKELDAFARAVIYAFSESDPRQLYAAHNAQAYQQYLAEVVSNLSGMRDEPRLFFESDLPMRKAWGDRIAADMARYNASIKESAAQTVEEPDQVAALRVELEKVNAGLAALQAEMAKTSTEPAGEEATGEA